MCVKTSFSCFFVIFHLFIEAKLRTFWRPIAVTRSIIRVISLVRKDSCTLGEPSWCALVLLFFFVNSQKPQYVLRYQLLTKGSHSFSKQSHVWPSALLFLFCTFVFHPVFARAVWHRACLHPMSASWPLNVSFCMRELSHLACVSPSNNVCCHRVGTTRQLGVPSTAAIQQRLATLTS